MKLTITSLSSLIQRIHRRPFYVTTPIFYVNAVPHLGHLYTAIVADTIQRFEKLTNPDVRVIFSTGTDEHGTKIQQAAAKAGLSPPIYCDNISEEYRNLFNIYNVEYTDFIRTTEKRHKTAVQHIWNKLLKKDYIYKAKYSGWYSVNDEAFVPETQLKDDVKNGENVKVSAESGHQVEWTEETNYMFRLSAFKSYLQDWLKLDGLITPSKFQKQLQTMLDNENYFPDISVSRPASRVHWAIPVPNDEDQSIYVWLDALINYLSVIGYPNEEMKQMRAWPADVQVVGKDILKFHGIYWPAFLMALKLHPPRQIVCHSHWTVDGQKMSKSLNNVVSPQDTPVSPSALRYMLLREATMHADANYSEAKLINIVNSELADTLGNLVSRCTGAALNPNGEFPVWQKNYDTFNDESTSKLKIEVEKLHECCHHFYRNYQFYKVADSVIHTLHLANLFFEAHKPWELKKNPDSKQQLDCILHITLETLRICGIILQPLIPELCDKLLDKLAIDKNLRCWQYCEKPSWCKQNTLLQTTQLKDGKLILFQRIHKKKDIQHN